MLLASRTALALALALLGATPAEAKKGRRAKSAPPAFAELDDAGLTAAIAARRAEGGDFAATLERLTRGLVGAPYVLSPLGEGAPPDADPRFRLDAFDCTTLVETALAFSRSSSAAGVRAALERIRYSGPPRGFDQRRHLIVGQWISGLTADGWLRDVTEEVGKTDAMVMRFVLDAERWKKRRVARQLTLDPAVIPSGTFEIPIIPIGLVLRHAAAIPPGTILNVVREDVPWSPVVVTHQGLVLAAPGGALIVRHASPISKRVIDEPVEHMIRRYSKPNPWRIVGIQLLAIKEK